jgi:hypothetical protein
MISHCHCAGLGSLDLSGFGKPASTLVSMANFESSTSALELIEYPDMPEGRVNPVFPEIL